MERRPGLHFNFITARMYFYSTRHQIRKLPIFGLFINILFEVDYKNTEPIWNDLLKLFKVRRHLEIRQTIDFLL